MERRRRIQHPTDAPAGPARAIQVPDKYCPDKGKQHAATLTSREYGLVRVKLVTGAGGSAEYKFITFQPGREQYINLAKSNKELEVDFGKTKVREFGKQKIREFDKNIAKYWNSAKIKPGISAKRKVCKFGKMGSLGLLISALRGLSDCD